MAQFFEASANGGPARLRHLERCWQHICDLDPMILRARQLRSRGSLPQAASLEQELLPLI
ncbi:MAG: hypothetical protein QM522_08060 [Chitinophagaceae bacterium]|jgi:hypothetical protein|nr:hypothetical protein [Chitinophagaceae bacterium]